MEFRIIRSVTYMVEEVFLEGKRLITPLKVGCRADCRRVTEQDHSPRLYERQPPGTILMVILARDNVLGARRSRMGLS